MTEYFIHSGNETWRGSLKSGDRRLVERAYAMLVVGPTLIDVYSLAGPISLLCKCWPYLAPYFMHTFLVYGVRHAKFPSRIK